MANIPFKKVRVVAEDVPSATLPDPVPANNCVADLKRFLQARGVRPHGLKKAELVRIAEEVIQKDVGISPEVERGETLLWKDTGYCSMESITFLSNI